MGSLLPGLDLLRLEPEGNLLLRVLNTVAAVAHVAADVLHLSASFPKLALHGKQRSTDGTYQSVVTADSARGRGERVSSAQDGASGLDGVAAFPDHGGDGARVHVWMWVSGGVEERAEAALQATSPGKKGLSDRSA